MYEKYVAYFGNPVIQASPGGEERAILGYTIEATDTEIDRMVYELYELTEEEMWIVKGKMKNKFT